MAYICQLKTNTTHFPKNKKKLTQRGYIHLEIGRIDVADGELDLSLQAAALTGQLAVGIGPTD